MTRVRQVMSSAVVCVLLAVLCHALMVDGAMLKTHQRMFSRLTTSTDAAIKPEELRQELQLQEQENIELWRDPTAVQNTYRELHLVFQYYVDKRPIRRKELRAALRMNLNNPHIDYIHLLLEKESDFPHDLVPKERRATIDKMGPNRNSLPKVVSHLIGHRLTFKDGVEYAQDRLKGKMVLLMNADVFFDESVKELHYVRDLKEQKLSYVLSRYEHHRNGDLQSYYCVQGSDGSSADVFIWTPPLECSDYEKFKKNVGYPLGTWGGENRWMYELNHLCGLHIKNPCFTVIIHHVHDSVDFIYKMSLPHTDSPAINGWFLRSPPVALGPMDYEDPNHKIFRRADPFNRVQHQQQTYDEMLRQSPPPTPAPSGAPTPQPTPATTGGDNTPAPSQQQQQDNKPQQQPQSTPQQPQPQPQQTTQTPSQTQHDATPKNLS